jgi:hypothetical protein
MEAEQLRVAIEEEAGALPSTGDGVVTTAHTCCFLPAKLFIRHSREHQASPHFPHLGKSFPASPHTAQRMDCLSKREDCSTASRAGWRGGIGPLLPPPLELDPLRPMALLLEPLLLMALLPVAPLAKVCARKGRGRLLPLLLLGRAVVRIGCVCLP